MQVNNILMKQSRARYKFVAPPDHHQNGMCENRVKQCKKIIGKLDLENNPMSILNLQVILCQSAELLNSTPLGSTLGETDEILDILTPNKLAGKFSKRRLMKPVTIPPDVSSIMREHEEKWQEIVKLYSNSIIPALLKNQKWFKEENEGIRVGGVVMFKKRSSNFVPGYSLGIITELHLSADGVARQATVEYVGGIDSDEINMDKEDSKVVKRKTVRDTNSLILLHDVTGPLDDDLKRLHYEFLRMEGENLREEIKHSTRSMVTTAGREAIKCGNCEVNNKRESCQHCNRLQVIASQEQYQVKIGEYVTYETQGTRQIIETFEDELKKKRFSQSLLSIETVPLVTDILVSTGATLRLISINQDEERRKVEKVTVSGGENIITIKLNYSENELQIREKKSTLKPLNLGEISKKHEKTLRRLCDREINRKHLNNIIEDQYNYRVKWEGTTPDKKDENKNHSTNFCCCCVEHCKSLHQIY